MNPVPSTESSAPCSGALRAPTPPPAFTAAVLATALAVTPQRIRKQLRDIAPSDVRIVSGQETAAWTLDQLPESIRQRLADESRRQHCRTVEALLTMPRRRYEPAVPLAKIADSDIQTATQLRAALLPWLIGQHDLSLSSAELEGRGVADYRREFGNTVTTRYWRELFMRTIRRDNGFEEWNRLEIYLPEKPALKFTIAPAGQADFEQLESYLAACSNPHAPNKTECAGIWLLALEKFTELVNAGESQKRAGRRVREWLFARAPFLSRSREALLMAWTRKLAAWQTARGDAKALRDGRENNGASFALPEDDRDLLIHRAVFTYRGQVPPAWRELLKAGFSPAVIERYAGKAANKSHVPASVLDSVGPEVEIMTTIFQGRRAFDAIKGHVTRDYSGIDSLHCISGDDFTLNTYFYVPDGQGWFQLTRGQVILFIDFRSSRILGWALEPRKSYSSLTIRSLCTHVFGEFGVPEILYFEQGIWKNATLLKGQTAAFGFPEISQGLREFGVTFKHAIRPRSKTVERIGGMFQDIAEAEPGYCGRDERRDAPESLRKQMAEVETRKVHPSKYFYDFAQWNTRLGELVERYNTEPQQGHMLAGLSPDEAFKKFMNPNDPPKQFGAGLRYLLAHDKRVAQVTLNGVTIQIGKQKFNYRGQEISHLVNREVLAWFDPENPETITVTNPDRTNPICVARSQSPGALESFTNPDAGTLGRELARIEDQASHMKTRYNVVKAKFELPQRRLLATAQAMDLGRAITSQKAAVTTRADDTRRRADANRSEARRLDIPAVMADEDEQTRRALELMRNSSSAGAEETVPEMIDL